MLCPCWIGEDPDNGTCQSALAYHIDKGSIDGLDVSGRTCAVAAFIPGNVLAGNLRVIRYVDDGATPEQEAALLAAFRGEKGGPLADLANLVGEEVDARRAPITFTVDEGKGTLEIGDVVLAEMAPYRGPTGKVDHAGREHLLDHSGLRPPMSARRAASAWSSRRSASTWIFLATTPSRAPSASPPEASATMLVRARYQASGLASPLTALAWAALWLWASSPYGRYLDHGDWTQIGLAAGICSVLPAGAVLLPGLLYVGGWMLMTAAMMLPTTLPLLEIVARIGAARPDGRLLLGLRDRRLSRRLVAVRPGRASGRSRPARARAAEPLAHLQRLGAGCRRPGAGRACSSSAPSSGAASMPVARPWPSWRSTGAAGTSGDRPCCWARITGSTASAAAGRSCC